MSSLQEGMAEASLRIMRSPRSVDIEITSKCNLKCLYCYRLDNPIMDYNDLPTEDWTAFFEELGSMAVMEVCLSGGEPFLRPDLKDLLEGIIRNRMRFSILSNGFLIDDSIAEFIASTGRCNRVQISVDGSSSKTHDICRGKGSFEGAIRGIKLLQRYGIPLTVRVTIHHHNVRELDKIAGFLLDDLGLPGFSTNSVGYLGSCQKNEDYLFLTVEDRQIAMDTLHHLDKERPGRIFSTAGPLSEAKYWHEMEEARLNNAPPFTSCGRLSACGCPNQKISIRSDGIITPCNILSHIELGRINKDSLQEIWLKSPVLNRFRMRHEIPLSDFEFCKDCPYIPYCTGNCPGMAYGRTGQLNHPGPDDCLRNFLDNGGRIP